MKTEELILQLKQIVKELENRDENQGETSLLVWDHDDNWDAVSMSLNCYDSGFDLEMKLNESYSVTKKKKGSNYEIGTNNL